MTRHWTGMSFAALLVLGACGAETPAAPAVAPTPQAQQQAGDQAIASLLPPNARPGPRGGWRRVRVDNADVATAFVDTGTVHMEGDARRAWIIMNFRDSMPIPETGGRAFSVALVGDYRCESREWRPLESIWFRQRDAQRLEWRQPSRRPEFRAVEAGTATDLFLTTACNAPLPRRSRPR